MSNTDRKARKRAGIKFSKTAKVLTPPDERVVPEAVDRNGRTSGPTVSHISKRALKRMIEQKSFRSE